MPLAGKSPIQKPSLTLRRHYPAPIEKVYRAWTDPEALKLWFGPEDEGRILVAETNLEVGGRYRIVMEMADGEQHRVGGVYREVVPNEKLSFTWAWESTPERESIVTIMLKKAGGGTDMTLTPEQFFDEAARDRHEHGWTAVLERLGRHVSTAQESNPGRSS
jgi:uncharacterized protein YndB with AHSA1/START domain